LPILIVSFILITQPRFYVSKFSDPIFWPTVFGIVCLFLFGNFLIHRMVNFKY
jgi:tight adherence protein B